MPKGLKYYLSLLTQSFHIHFLSNIHKSKGWKIKIRFNFLIEGEFKDNVSLSFDWWQTSNYYIFVVVAWSRDVLRQKGIHTLVLIRSELQTCFVNKRQKKETRKNKLFYFLKTVSTKSPRHFYKYIINSNWSSFCLHKKLLVVKVHTTFFFGRAFRFSSSLFIFIFTK